ncbi:MAG: hypothetical protein AAB263_10005 [Planctomycetota bacterium]
MLEFIHTLLPLWVLGALSGSGYIVWALYLRDGGKSDKRQETTRRTPQAPARPVAPPLGPIVQPRTPAIGGSPEHQRRGSAPTVKLASAAPTIEPATDRIVAPTKPGTAPSEDAEANELFAGLAAAKANADARPAPETPTPASPKETPKDVIEHAGRIEAYGFHIGSKAASESGARAAAAAIDGSAGQPRTQTQELDDILKRIDAVLSESNAPSAEATMVNQQPGVTQSSSAEATLPVSQPAPPEKIEKNDRAQRHQTDPNQQKLF